jgi:hypothetical protein
VARHKFAKNTFWSLNFKNNANHTISIPKYFSNLILVQHFILLFFSPRLREEKERSSDFSGRKRKVLLIPI